MKPPPEGYEGEFAHLLELFPGWTFWHGVTTKDYFAAPPRDDPVQQLVSAPTVDELERLVRERVEWLRGT
jgi:hypothetical protein